MIKTFWELLNSYDKIQIPEIQRDYVQGRHTEIIRENRKEFVRQLVDSSNGGNSMSLNFVYGETIKVSNESVFIPIDGQQRLTTLFLFHLYVATMKGIHRSPLDKKEWDTFKKFEYNTRITSNRFFRKLVGDSCENSGIYETLKEALKDVSEENGISDIIRDSPWFSFAWGNDTTIDSCVEMLKEIDMAVNIDARNCSEIWKRLTESKCITFTFLELSDKQYGDSSELYIRMNSRGRQLTDYENFKAELYEKCPGIIGDNFKKQIDDAWYSMLWNVCSHNLNDGTPDSSNISRTADNLFLYIYRTVFTNMLCELTREKPETGKDLDDQLTPEAIKSDMIYIAKYSDRRPNHENGLLLNDKAIGTKFIETFSNLMDFLTWLYKCPDSKDDDLPELKEFISERVLNNASADFTYQSRFLLYIITKFADLARNGGFDSCSICGIKEMLRIFTNLTNNIGFDSPGAFRYGIYSTYELSQKDPKYILCIQDMVKNPSDCEFFEGVIDKQTFRKNEAKEEALKLNLIYNLRDDSQRKGWKEVIYATDRFLKSPIKSFSGKGVDYFCGQIYFIFKMVSGDKIIEAESVKDNLVEFKKYCEAIFAIFGDILSESHKTDKDKKFHRGLLLFGNYGIKNREWRNQAYEWKYPSLSDTHKNNDWRGFLRLPASGEWPTTYDSLKSFIDDFLKWSENQNVDSKMDYGKYIDEKILERQNSNDLEAMSPEEKVIYCLLTKPDYFNKMSKGNVNSNYFYRYDGGDRYFIINDNQEIDIRLED